MSQEELDFQHFKDKQLKFVDFSAGQIDVWIYDKLGKPSKSAHNVGSKNQDGYVRLWCNKRLRMKHRLLFWLFHGYLPEEVDHEDGVRNNNSISNLLDSTRSKNTTNTTKRTFKQLTANEVHELCKDHISGQFHITALAAKYGRSRTQIKAILTKKYWSKVSDQYF